MLARQKIQNLKAKLMEMESFNCKLQEQLKVHSENENKVHQNDNLKKSVVFFAV